MNIGEEIDRARKRFEENANLNRFRSMIATGHLQEAADWARQVAFSVPEFESRALLLILAEAILDPNPPRRGRGDKFTTRMTFEKLVAEIATAEKVLASGKPVTVAFDTIGQSPTSTASPSTVKRRFYRHKPKDSQ